MLGGDQIMWHLVHQSRNLRGLEAEYQLVQCVLLEDQSVFCVKTGVWEYKSRSRSARWEVKT